MIKPGNFGRSVAADNRRMDFDFGNEQLLHLKKEIDLLFIGDSITQLWDLNAYLGRDKFIVNRGIGGDVSEFVLKRFMADVIQLKPKKCILMIGTNDISATCDDLWWRTKGADPQKVMDEYKKNIQEMVKLCWDHAIELVICSIIPSDVAPPFDKQARWDLTRDMNEFLKNLPNKYIDYHSRLTNDGKTLIYELSSDGIHPNAKCYEIMADLLKKKLLS